MTRKRSTASMKREALRVAHHRLCKAIKKFQTMRRRHQIVDDDGLGRYSFLDSIDVAFPIDTKGRMVM